jgi:ubiquinone/menaquinone biosynthesis C-methylase UbiE
MPGSLRPEGEPGAFDSIAGSYDGHFSSTLLGRYLRQRVWARLGEHFHTGDTVLELACGTGEDALWMAGKGMRVVATDGSAGMLRVASRKTNGAEHNGQSSAISLVRLTLQQVMAGQSPFKPETFNGVLSDFGGLNTVDKWALLAARLSAVMKRGGKLILVPMGPMCPWEIGWHLTHLDIRRAMRRFRPPAEGWIGDSLIPIWYPSARQLRRDLSPWFTHVSTESLGLWLPPTYLTGPLPRWPLLLRLLDYLERITARITGGWGDHYISVFVKAA